MSNTKKNHINPQSLLKFWCVNNKLSAFNKVTKKIQHNMATTEVCFIKKFIPQDLEDEFGREFDSKISPTVERIISAGTICDEDKLFISKFQARQALRNPLLRKIVEDTIQKFLGIKDISLPIMRLGAKQSDQKIIDKHLNMHWQLLTNDKPCFVTSEGVDTTDCHDKNDGIESIYFPISPKHCLIMSDKKVDVELDCELIIWINNQMARYPYSNYIIFNENYDPMPNIILFENGSQIYPPVTSQPDKF